MNELLEALRALPKAERRAAALLANPTFQEAVRLASEEDDEALFALVRGDRMTALVALEALAQRDGDEGTLMLLVPGARGAYASFLLRALDRRVGEGLVSRLLVATGDAWLRSPLKDLRELIERRDEDVRLGEIGDDRLEDVFALVEVLGDALDPSVRKDLVRRRGVRQVRGRLDGIGRVHADDAAQALDEAIVGDDAFDRDLASAGARDRHRPLGAGRR